MHPLLLFLMAQVSQIINVCSFNQSCQLNPRNELVCGCQMMDINNFSDVGTCE